MEIGQKSQRSKNTIKLVELHFFSLKGQDINKRPTGLNDHLPEYHRLYTDFLSEGLIFAYQQTHNRINKTQQWQRKSTYQYCLNTIATNVLYIDRVEDFYENKS